MRANLFDVSKKKKLNLFDVSGPVHRRNITELWFELCIVKSQHCINVTIHGLSILTRPTILRTSFSFVISSIVGARLPNLTCLRAGCLNILLLGGWNNIFPISAFIIIVFNAYV